jgi:hypothetical protein
MAFELLLTTSGTPSVIYVHGRELIHPVVDLNILDEVTFSDLFTDKKFIDGLATGDFTLKFKNNVAITDISDAFFPGTYGRLNNPAATTDPTTGDDDTKGYGPGSWWINTTTPAVFICASAAAGAAVWQNAGAGGGGGQSVDVQDATPVEASQTTSSIYVDLPGASFTTAAGATRHYLVVFTATASVDKANKSINVRLVIGGVVDADSERQIDAPNSNALITIATTHAGTIAPGTEIKVQWSVTGGGGPAVTLGQGTLDGLGVED